MQNSSSSMIFSQQILENLFISQTDPKSSKDAPKKRLRINLKLLKKISQCSDNYRTAIQLVLILQRILYTGKRRLSLRQLIYKNSSSFRNNDKQLSFSKTFSSSSSLTSPKKQKQNIEQSRSDKKSQNQDQKQSQKQHKKPKQTSNNEQPKQKDTVVKDTQHSDEQSHQFVSDELNLQQKRALSECLNNIKANLVNTIYESKINFVVDQLLTDQKDKKITNFADQDTYKRMITANGLGLDGNKNNKILDFITKGYQSLDGKFVSFQSLFTFLSAEVLPFIQRKILSISINSHTQRQSFISKAITFISEYFLHQFTLEVKINKATLIQNRIFVQKIFKQNFKKHQTLIMSNLTNIINEALLCPSNIQIQLPLFRLLKRMYYLWGTISAGGSSHFIQLKSDSQNLGQFIKYPLLVNLKNISLYSKLTDNEDEVKEAAMFCYRILNTKEDLYLCNEIQTLSQMRFIRESKYFSSKAYAFSEQISKIYDTFDLRMGFWKYYKRVERGQVWSYNVLVQKPNSLFIWQFYLQGYDIRFGIYKVQNFNKHSIDDFTRQVECKQILKLQKYTVIQSQPQKGFVFLKNGLYKIVFDNSYSSFRGKDLSYMMLHLQSQN